MTFNTSQVSFPVIHKVDDIASLKEINKLQNSHLSWCLFFSSDYSSRATSLLTMVSVCLLVDGVIFLCQKN